MEDLIKELHELAAGARAQLEGITPRHARYRHYSDVARLADAAANALAEAGDEIEPLETFS